MSGDALILSCASPLKPKAGSVSLYLRAFVDFQLYVFADFRKSAITYLRFPVHPPMRLRASSTLWASWPPPFFPGSPRSGQVRESGARRLPSTPARTGPRWGMTAALCACAPVASLRRGANPSKVATMIQALLTDEQRTQLLANGRITAEGGDHDPQPVVKLFTPDAHATWLLTELDPEDGDTAYGLRPLRHWHRHARTGSGKDFGSGVHRRAVQAAHRTRPVFHGEAHAIGVHAAGPNQLFDHRLIEPDSPLQRVIRTL